jgi:predicted PurR-regulated permease PerM
MFATGIKLFLPLFIAYLIAVLLNPVIDLFENKLYFARTRSGRSIPKASRF